MKTVNISGEFGRRITLVVADSDFSLPSEPNDLTWIQCRVGAELGGFHGRLDMLLALEELTKFAIDLEMLTNSTTKVVKFEPIEPGLNFGIEESHTGSCWLSGKLFNANYGESNLSFRFQTDRTFLLQALNETKTLLREIQGKNERL